MVLNRRENSTRIKNAAARLTAALPAGIRGILPVRRERLKQSVHTICAQLSQLTSKGRTGMVMVEENDDLATLVGALNDYLTALERSAQSRRLGTKEFEIQVRVAEAERLQMQAVILGIAEAVIVTDAYDELLLANQAAELMFGFSIKQCRSRPVQSALWDNELVHLIRETRRTRNPRVVCKLERPGHRPQHPQSLKVHASCVLDAQGAVLGVVLIVHDVTAEEELVRMKDDFASSVSHELKTPLASIQAYAEMLREDEVPDPDARRRFCEVILEQSQRLNRLIDNILAMSRLEAGRLKASKHQVDLAAVVREVVRAMRPQAREKDLILQDDASDPVPVHADGDLMVQAVMNLVSNAIKYSHAGGHVWVRARRQNDQAVIEVQDEGVGIPAQSRGKVFQKFHRLPEHSGLAGGTGVGLHLVREVVEGLHDGRIAITSEQDRGSTFVLTLPLQEQLEAVAAL